LQILKILCLVRRMTVKIPILVEIIGESAVGKTHTACLFPKSVLFDCTPEKEGRIIGLKLYKDNFDNRYFDIINYNDFLNALSDIPEGTKTIVIDTSKDFVRIITDEWLRRENVSRRAAGKTALRRVHPTILFGNINNMVDAEVKRLMSTPYNVVFTSAMTDEYVNDTKTGRRIRDGYSRLPFQCWLRIAIEISGGKRIYKIIKNRFIDSISNSYVKSFTNEDLHGKFFDKILDITFRASSFDDEMAVK